jgi:hypothetical protein
VKSVPNPGNFATGNALVESDRREMRFSLNQHERWHDIGEETSAQNTEPLNASVPVENVTPKEGSLKRRCLIGKQFSGNFGTLELRNLHFHR